jgi:peroxiredoxin (alkyl hydroperoxide reductase subunit C)
MLKPGDPAPPFDLPCALNGQISQLSLSKIASETVVLFFYPHDFSFICPTEVVGFNRALDQFKAENATIVGASVDDAECHLRWARELGGVMFALLADKGGKLARAYGIFDDKEGAALRSTFILDQTRTVAASSCCPMNVGRSIHETLRIVRALRTGALCPADWEPGVALGSSNNG